MHKEDSVQIWKTSCHFKPPVCTNTGFDGDCKSKIFSSTQDTYDWS